MNCVKPQVIGTTYNEAGKVQFTMVKGINTIDVANSGPNEGFANITKADDITQ